MSSTTISIPFSAPSPNPSWSFDARIEYVPFIPARPHELNPDSKDLSKYEQLRLKHDPDPIYRPVVVLSNWIDNHSNKVDNVDNIDNDNGVINEGDKIMNDDEAIEQPLSPVLTLAASSLSRPETQPKTLGQSSLLDVYSSDNNDDNANDSYEDDTEEDDDREDDTKDPIQDAKANADADVKANTNANANTNIGGRLHIYETAASYNARFYTARIEAEYGVDIETEYKVVLDRKDYDFAPTVGILFDGVKIIEYMNRHHPGSCLIQQRRKFGEPGVWWVFKLIDVNKYLQVYFNFDESGKFVIGKPSYNTINFKSHMEQFKKLCPNQDPKSQAFYKAYLCERTAEKHFEDYQRMHGHL